MPIRVVGFNYRVASIEVRENFAMDSDAVSKTLLEWRESFPGIEAALLSTCNRTELYFASDLDVLPSYEEVFPFLVAPSRRHNNDITFDRYSDVLQTLEERDAAEQLFSVTSSLDSMILGEPQIHSQVKHAYELASEAQTTGPILNDAFQTAFKTAKRVTGVDTCEVVHGACISGEAAITNDSLLLWGKAGSNLADARTP